MRIPILLLSLLSALPLWAEDALQVIPTRIQEGNGTLQIQLVSSSPISACQVDLSLPQGVTLGTAATGTNTQSNHRVLTHSLGASAEHSGYNTYRLLLYSTANSLLKSTSGQVISLPITSTLSEGTYPLYADHIVMDNGAAGSNKVTIREDLQESYATVGQPSTQRLRFEAYVPSFVLDSIRTDVSITQIDLTAQPTLGSALAPANPNALILTDTDRGYAGYNEVTEGQCDAFVLTDGYPFEALTSFTATSASYQRNGQSTPWGTLCLPFPIASNESVQYYRLSASNATEQSLLFQQIEEVEANQPVLFRILGESDESGKYYFSTQSGACTIPASTGTQSDALDEIDDWAMYGTYTRRSNVTDIYYISKGDFWYAERGVTLPPFRGWFTYGGSVDAPVARFFIAELESGENGLSAIEESADGTVSLRYNLQGQPSQTTSRQIQIINGKKTLQK